MSHTSTYSTYTVPQQRIPFPLCDDLLVRQKRMIKALHYREDQMHYLSWTMAVMMGRTCSEQYNYEQRVFYVRMHLFDAVASMTYRKTLIATPNGKNGRYDIKEAFPDERPVGGRRIAADYLKCKDYNFLAEQCKRKWTDFISTHVVVEIEDEDDDTEEMEDDSDFEVIDL